MGAVRRILVIVAGNTVALAVATWIFHDIRAGRPSTGPVEDLVTLLLVGVVLGLVNAIVAPLAKLFSLPFIILTLGLFLLIVNAAMLWLTTEIASLFNLTFRVEGFWTYVLGALVISLVSMAVQAVFGDD